MTGPLGLCQGTPTTRQVRGHQCPLRTNTQSPKSNRVLTGKEQPGSALLLTRYVAVVLSAGSSTADLQEGNGKSQDKGIATRFKTSVWGASYQGPAHSVSLLSKLSVLESKPFLAIALAAIALAATNERRKPLTKAYAGLFIHSPRKRLLVH